MKWEIFILAVLLLIVVCYVGWILGVLLLCDTIPELRRVKRFAWLIPIILVCTFSDMFFTYRGKKRISVLLSYLRLGQKSLILAYIMSKCLQECKVAQTQRIKKVRSRECFDLTRNRVIACGDQLLA